MEQCLFSGQQIDRTTLVEHAIPASICGRITSRTVTSSDFNSKAGNLCDGLPKDCYAFFLQALSPALSSNHRPGTMEIEYSGKKGKFVIRDGLFDAKQEVTSERDADTNQLTSLSGPNPQRLEQIWNQVHPNNKPATFEWIPPRDRIEVRRKLPLLKAEIELAFLKSSLCSFDALIQRYGGMMFTRFDELKIVRDVVTKIILGQEDSVYLYRHSLGLQYARLPFLNEVRTRLPFPKTPFEHYLVASAEPGSAVLDIAFVAFSFDPYVFRASTAWKRDGFTAVIANGVLAGMHPSGIGFYAGGQTLGKPGMYSGLISSDADSREHVEAAKIISQNRSMAISDAIVYVERNCTEHIVTGIKSFGVGQTSLNFKQAIKGRLRRVYGRPDTEIIWSSEFDRICDAIWTKHSWSEDPVNNFRSQVRETSDLKIFDLYRECLEAAISAFGLPQVSNSYGISKAGK